MGAVKELVMATADATLTLAELQASGVSVVLTSSPDGWSWFIAPPGDEYMQEDWIFHALRRGLSPSFDGAVTALADAVVAVLPTSKFSVAFMRRSGT